jgi:hypothetical protein
VLNYSGEASRKDSLADIVNLNSNNNFFHNYGHLTLENNNLTGGNINTLPGPNLNIIQFKNHVHSGSTMHLKQVGEGFKYTKSNTIGNIDVSGLNKKTSNNK